MLEDISADHVREFPRSGGSPASRSASISSTLSGKLIAVRAGPLDSDNFVTALSEDLGQISAGATHVQHSFAAALGRKRTEQNRVAAVRAELVCIAGMSGHA